MASAALVPTPSNPSAPRRYARYKPPRPFATTIIPRQLLPTYNPSDALSAPEHLARHADDDALPDYESSFSQNGAAIGFEARRAARADDGYDSPPDGDEIVYAAAQEPEDRGHSGDLLSNMLCAW